MFRRTRERRAAGASTSLIAADTTLRGDIVFSGALHICGRVIGNVRGEGEAMFTLSEQGVIEGSVQAPYAVINGTVRGDIHADAHLQLAAGARIENLGSGVVYCLLLNHFFPNAIPTPKIIMIPRSPNDHRTNLRRLQEAISALDIRTISFDVSIRAIRCLRSLK